MSVIDDITAILTPVLHTNTTKDITAAAVKTALISAFTDVVNDEIARADANTTAINSAIGGLPALARQAEPIYYDLLATTGLRTGGVKFGIQNLGVLGSYGTLIDKVIDSSGTVSDGPNYIVTDYMVVLAGSSLTVADPGPSFPIVWYNASKTFISSTNGPFTHGQVVTVPAGAFYARWCIQYYGIGDSANKTQLLQGNIATADFQHKFKTFPATVSMFKSWLGKTWMLAGDSMGAQEPGNTWFQDAAQWHGCATVYNEAQAGGTSVLIMNKWNRPTDFTRVPLVAGDFTNVDAVITQVGVNDRTIGTPLGTISDATTAGTYYGNMKKFVEFALTSNPSTKVILGTPTGDMGSDALRDAILPFRQAIRDICDLYALPCWDVGRTSQLSRFTKDFYTVDNLHPGNPGAPRYDGVHTPAAQAIGMKMVFGSNFTAFMQTVFPSDFTGDPLNNTLNPTST